MKIAIVGALVVVMLLFGCVVEQSAQTSETSFCSDADKASCSCANPQQNPNGCEPANTEFAALAAAAVQAEADSRGLARDRGIVSACTASMNLPHTMQCTTSLAVGLFHCSVTSYPDGHVTVHDCTVHQVQSAQAQAQVPESDLCSDEDRANCSCPNPSQNPGACETPVWLPQADAVAAEAAAEGLTVVERPMCISAGDEYRCHAKVLRPGVFGLFQLICDTVTTCTVGPGGLESCYVSTFNCHIAGT